MGDEVRADPVELAKLAGKTLDASIELGDGWRQAQADLAVPAAAFGNLPAGQGVHRAHVAAAEDGDRGVGRLVAVYEGDVDRLYRVAFAYQQADREAARRTHRSGGGMRAE
jgi:hypothetical protein